MPKWHKRHHQRQWPRTWPYPQNVNATRIESRTGKQTTRCSSNIGCCSGAVCSSWVSLHTEPGFKPRHFGPEMSTSYDRWLTGYCFGVPWPSAGRPKSTFSTCELRCELATKPSFGTAKNNKPHSQPVRKLDCSTQTGQVYGCWIEVGLFFLCFYVGLIQFASQLGNWNLFLFTYDG